MGDIRPYQPPALRPRILVVDDSGSVREHLARLLTAPPLEAEVEQAKDGAAGLRAVSEADYDCVICDLEMPVLDGRKFLAAVRQKRAPDDLPVLILTVRDETVEKVERFDGEARRGPRTAPDSGRFVTPVSEDATQFAPDIATAGDQNAGHYPGNRPPFTWITVPWM